MAFINIIKSLEFLSNGILKTNEIEGIFIAEKEQPTFFKNSIIITDEKVLHIAKTVGDNIYIAKNFDLEEAEKLAIKLAKYESIIAVGSGSIFDLTKHASFLAKKPFYGFITALSVNAYLSSTASLYEGDTKKSFPSHLAKALYFDLDILKKAPISLTKAGIGEVFARMSAENDCIISKAEKNTKYENIFFDFRRPSEEFILNNPSAFLKLEDEFFLQLLENSLFSGFAMHLYGSSFPASGTEHAMAHIYDANHKNQFWHGLQVAAFTIETLKMQEQFQKQYNLEIKLKELESLYKMFEIPASFKDLNLNEKEFDEIKNKAKTLRDRFSILNKF